MPEKSLQDVLGQFQEENYTVKICKVISEHIPGSPDYCFYNELSGAIQRLAGGDSEVEQRALSLVASKEMQQALWVMDAIDKADMGMSVVSGLKSVFSFFGGGKKSTFESDPEQALDAALKAAGMGYLIYTVFPGTIKEKIASFQQLPAGKEMGLYYAVCEIAIPFADNVAAGGVSMISKLFSSRKQDMSQKFSAVAGQGAAGNAFKVLEQFEGPLGGYIDQSKNHSKSIMQKVSGMLPTGAGVASFFDSASGVAASGLDAMPVWTYLGGRLVAEACVHRAMQGEVVSESDAE